MTPLEDIIKQMIREQGPMRFDSYMALCLGHPEHGYYMTHDPFGADGDFTTAPEISQMFGEMVGAWIADSWMKLGSPNPFTLLECGAGRGTLIQDALRVTKNVPGFHESMTLRLLETSPVLRQAQESSLAAYGAVWHSDTESIPSDSPFIVIGNEFLDALPVRQMVLSDAGWTEKFVDLDINDTLRIHDVLMPESEKSVLPQLLLPPKVGDHVEVSHEQERILDDLIKIILKQKGIALFIDYGFTLPVAGDTIQALKNHRFCGVLDTPGESDITAHVNFARLADFAMEKEMTVHGPVSQGDYLRRIGIVERAESLRLNATDQQRGDIDAALKRLAGNDTKGGDMGELFRVIAFSSDPAIELAGFA